jgi:hypothetical protein
MLAQLVDKKTINNSGMLRSDAPAAKGDLPLFYSDTASTAQNLITTERCDQWQQLKSCEFVK